MLWSSFQKNGLPKTSCTDGLSSGFLLNISWAIRESAGNAPRSKAPCTAVEQLIPCFMQAEDLAVAHRQRFLECHAQLQAHRHPKQLVWLKNMQKFVCCGICICCTSAAMCTLADFVQHVLAHTMQPVTAKWLPKHTQERDNMTIQCNQHRQHTHVGCSNYRLCWLQA